MAKKGWYYDLSWIVRVIIAIVPILSLIVHLLARLSATKGLLHLILLIAVHVIFGWNILYIVDLITTLVIKKIFLT